jgi:hypothetical protein
MGPGHVISLLLFLLVGPDPHEGKLYLVETAEGPERPRRRPRSRSLGRGNKIKLKKGNLSILENYSTVIVNLWTYPFQPLSY